MSHHINNVQSTIEVETSRTEPKEPLDLSPSRIQGQERDDVAVRFATLDLEKDIPIDPNNLSSHNNSDQFQQTNHYEQLHNTPTDENARVNQYNEPMCLSQVSTDLMYYQTTFDVRQDMCALATEVHEEDKHLLTEELVSRIIDLPIRGLLFSMCKPDGQYGPLFEDRYIFRTNTSVYEVVSKSARSPLEAKRRCLSRLYHILMECEFIRAELSDIVVGAAKFFFIDGLCKSQVDSLLSNNGYPGDNRSIDSNSSDSNNEQQQETTHGRPTSPNISMTRLCDSFLYCYETMPESPDSEAREIADFNEAQDFMINSGLYN